jgi:hypothetical protein
MSTGAIIGIVIAVVVVLVLGAMVLRLTLQQRELRARFGPEYDRVMEDRANRRAALRELSERERRHAELDLQPISATSRDRYRQSWGLIQSTFVDRPGTAVDEADRLVLTIMEERGYPVGDVDDRLALLSVDHASVLGHYRDAHVIRERHQQTQVTTEELRTAMVHYRTLIEDLLEDKPAATRRAPAVPAARSANRTEKVERVEKVEEIEPARADHDEQVADEKVADRVEEQRSLEVRDAELVREEDETKLADERRSTNSTRSVDA